MEQRIHDTVLLLSLVPLVSPAAFATSELEQEIRAGVERAGVMNFLKPETLEIF